MSANASGVRIFKHCILYLILVSTLFLIILPTMLMHKKQILRTVNVQQTTRELLATKLLPYVRNDSLALTPPMGWMHWERYRCTVDCDAFPNECISEKLFMKMADLLVSEGYAELGYVYLIVDDCWLATTRDIDGRMQPDPTRFPNGMKYLGDYIHSKGLKYGLYQNYGKLTCEGYPGLDNLELDAQTFADWGVDYIKIDACHTAPEDLAWGYTEFRRYLDKTGRPIVYSCSWPYYEFMYNVQSDYEAISKVCHLWRNYHDIRDNWLMIRNILNWYKFNQKTIEKYCGPGRWNDPDMLVIGNTGLTYQQSKAHMALWAILAAPLIMSNDLAAVRPEYKEILQNKQIIDVNQDPLGILGKETFKKGHIQIWIRKILPIVNGRYSYALLVLNDVIGICQPRKIVKNLIEISDELTAEAYIFTDLFNTGQAPKEPTQILNVTVFPNAGVVFFKIIPVDSNDTENGYY